MTVGKMDPVEVFSAGEKGRGLRATKDISTGEVVFSEASFAAVVFDSLSMQVCHACFRRQLNPHRCAQCQFAHYCDRTCQRAAWDEHKQECSAIRKMGKKPNENVRLAARIMWRMQKDTGVISDNQLTTLDLLEDHLSDMSPEDLKELKVDVQSFLHYWPKKSKPVGEDYVAHIFGVIKCNGFTLNDQRGLQAVGVGLFPNLCLVNHNCWPNCTVVLNHGNQTALDTAFHSDRRIELRALGNISTGEELTVSYVDFLNVSKDRQRLLKQQYYFDCSCDHCAHGDKDDLMTAVKEKVSSDAVKQVTDFSIQTLKKIEEAQTEGNFREVVKLCHECLEKQDPVFEDTNLHVLRILSKVSEVLSFLQQFQEASGYALRMVKGYGKLYHPNNAQLGIAIMRSGVTHWRAGLIEVGHELICRAFGILIITHGPHHPITQDLETMRVQTEMELRLFKQNEEVYHNMREAVLSQ
ncbi:histone-lysine N-methyltransferase SMYD1a [Misgurnus anguillicaudatus]|uniref:histone-lysine N-methyltransferase SMYD1a n=1 Tax=Misgurnus anguillicaudatus TaxID=75329 RepID=UPI0024349C3D|nr:histone-lysine N-methyltransferase SMYD1a [Misgurnus anguillicaudatus]